MPHAYAKLIGTRLPMVRLGEMIDGELRSVRASEALGSGRGVLVGMPGAFTPVCSDKHLPSLVRNADRLRQASITHIVCIVTSDPFSMNAWARAADPEGKVRFFSDRNLSFARALGLNRHEPRLFLGECSQRYLLTVQDGAIESARVEERVTDFGCTNVDALVLEGA